MKEEGVAISVKSIPVCFPACLFLKGWEFRASSFIEVLERFGSFLKASHVLNPLWINTFNSVVSGRVRRHASFYTSNVF